MNVVIRTKRFDAKVKPMVTDSKMVWLLLLIAAPLLHAQILSRKNSPPNNMGSGECVVKTPGNTVTMEITVHFETKQPTDGLNVTIVFADLHGIVLPTANVHATYIAEERYNLTARVGQQAMIGEYRLTQMRVASPFTYTRAFHVDYQDGKRNCISIEQGIQQPTSSSPEGEIVHVGRPQ